MKKDQALSVVIQAAERWHNELGEYIIPASEAANDGADYQPAFNELGEALEALQPPRMVKVHTECEHAIIEPPEGPYCPFCDHSITEGDIEERDRATLPPTEEFTRKQQELACCLYELYHGKGTWLTEVLLESPHDADMYSNYMADANDILREQTHLLTLPTVEAMAL